MSVRINDKYLKDCIGENDTSAVWEQAERAYKDIENKTGKGNDFLGWVNLPVDYDREEFSRVKAAAEKIKKNSEVLIVVGIGGSYLGARAAIEFIHSPLYNNLKKDTPDIYFLGNSLSADSLREVLSICEGRDFSINVISKSGRTTEPAIAFRILREILEEKYSKGGARERIFVTTDRNGEKSKIKALADVNGYETFVVPDDVGGRYSVLTAVGLLPIAVSGADVDAMMDGAKNAREKYYISGFSKDNDCLRYAVLRNALYSVKGKSIEILATYEPALTMFNEWWKQLYGESEGKDKKGIYPASVVFSADLHSLGQYIQDGARTVFETVVNIKESKNIIIIPADKEKIDGMDYIDNMSLDEVNHKAFLGTILAHTDGGTPNIIIDIDDRSERTFGELVYFFELACAISGYILGVNPFDQPGVEAYKKNMFALLGNPKYADIKEDLDERMNKLGVGGSQP